MTDCPIHEDCEFSHCDADMAAAKQAIADLNQRLIDRTSGLLDLVGRQALEIATWKRRHREAVRALMAALSPPVQDLHSSHPMKTEPLSDYEHVQVTAMEVLLRRNDLHGAQELCERIGRLKDGQKDPALSQDILDFCQKHTIA